jgi:hypothetical protein
MYLKFKIGSTFKLTESAIENYGEQYRDKVFMVHSYFTHYAKPGSNKPYGHPGFVEQAGSYLYETNDLKFALYDWEMIPV